MILPFYRRPSIKGGFFLMRFLNQFLRFGHGAPPRSGKAGQRCKKFQWRPRIEILEERCLLATIVTTASDALVHAGTSLRDAVVEANFAASGGLSDTITFAPGLNGDTITLTQGQLQLNSVGSATETIDGGGQ